MLACSVLARGPRTEAHEDGSRDQEETENEPPRLRRAAVAAHLRREDGAVTSGSALAARRYARALLDVSERDAAGPDGIRERLERLGAALAEHAQVATLLTHPGVAQAKKERLLSALLPEERSDGLVTRLLLLLIERRRLKLLPAILESYVTQQNAQRGVLSARVFSASPLDGRQLAELEAALAKATRASVQMTAQVEPRLGGGLVVNVGGRTLDGSVRGRLRTLRERLRQVAVAR
jgi:F-type H+-transporting ATPase subunit delta